MIAKEPRVLHISCHGLNIVSPHASFQMRVPEQENYLLFERENGEGELVSFDDLNRIIKKAMPKLEVVFFAACNSEIIGKLFQKCGAQHVICIQKKREVLDEAAIDFTKTFYDRLIRGMTICEAFDAAKADVEFKHKAVEASIFMIFKSSSHRNKECSRHP